MATVAEPLGLSAAGGRVGHLHHRRARAWPRRRACTSSRRAATRGATPWSASAAPGPAHAARVARILGVREVIVPPASGAASALGFLVAPISFELVTSLPGVLDELDLGGDQRAPRRPRGARARAPGRGRRGGGRRDGDPARGDAAARPGARHHRAAARRAAHPGRARHREGRLRARVPAPLHARLHGHRHPGHQLARAVRGTGALDRRRAPGRRRRPAHPPLKGQRRAYFGDAAAGSKHRSTTATPSRRGRPSRGRPSWRSASPRR